MLDASASRDCGIGCSPPAPQSAAVSESAGKIRTTDWSVKEANRRLGKLEAFAALLAEGVTRKQAVKIIDVGYATLWRWEKAFAKRGFNGLLPEKARCGRKSALKKLGLDPADLQQILDRVQGLNLDLNSTTGACRVFAQSEECPPRLADAILDPNRTSKHSIPRSIRDAVRVDKNAKKAHRGPRQLSLGGIWTPRKLDILPGDIFSADDTTPIWAWWVPWIQCEEYPFGVKLLQGQFLPVIDVASQKLITFALIAREKSSYRAADIWALFGHTFETVGLPRLGWQLERGSWESNLIAGQEIEYQQDELTLSRRVGGLRQLPTNITPWHLERYPAAELPKTLKTWTSYLPKSKSIEGWFNRSQTFEGTLWGSLGRDQMRAPYEKAKKQFQACSRKGATEDPRHHFLSQTEILLKIMDLAKYINAEPMEGEVFKGIPDQNFDPAVLQYPLRPLPDEDAWLYRRNWKTLTITQGWARVRLTDELNGERYSLFYGHPEIFARHEGQEVVVYYDLQHFEQPAHVILARTGEYLCAAEYFDRRGSFLDGDKAGHDHRKRWRHAVMTAYGTIAKHAPSRQLPAEIAARRAASTIISPPSTAAIRTPAPFTRPIRVELKPEQLAARRERLAEDAAIARQLLHDP
jgi:hypothetical protein